jgi:hypothetical protein
VQNWKRISTQMYPTNGMIQATCPFGSTPDLTTVNSSNYSMKCLVWQVPSGWPNGLVSINSILYQPKRVQSPVCPTGTTEETTYCRVANLSGWQISISNGASVAKVDAQNSVCE